MNTFIRDGLEFRNDKGDHGTIYHMGRDKVTKFYWEPVSTIEGKGSWCNLSPDLPYVLTQRTKMTNKLLNILRDGKLKYRELEFQSYPGSVKKIFIQMGTPENPGLDDGLIMDLIRESVDW